MATRSRPSPIKVLGLLGSPRRGGNTEMLLEQVMLGAADRGATTTTLVLCRLNIAPCRHCDACLKTGRCAIDDDMQEVHRQLRDADRIILASPVFFMGLTAQTKAMIDRCQALWALKYVLKLTVSLAPGKARRGLFVSVGGLPYTPQKLFGPARATVRAFFATLDVRPWSDLVYPNIDKKGEIAAHPTALRDAFQAGRDLVEERGDV